MTQNNDIHAHRILIIDFGSQYTQLIARRVREAGVYCEIWPYDHCEHVLHGHKPAGIILSGGPETVTVEAGPRAPQVVFDLNVPVLGICYGLQTMAAQLGGKVEAASHREYGYAQVRARGHSRLLTNIEDHASPEGYGLLAAAPSVGANTVSGRRGLVSSESNPACSKMATIFSVANSVVPSLNCGLAVSPRRNVIVSTGLRRSVPTM